MLLRTMKHAWEPIITSGSPANDVATINECHPHPCRTKHIMVNSCQPTMYHRNDNEECDAQIRSICGDLQEQCRSTHCS